jgi:beta-N-acetylhexosaminidase
VVVALRDPYELRYLPELPTYLCAFSFRPSAAQAAAEVLCGEVSPHGHTPVSVPDVGLEV